MSRDEDIYRLDAELKAAMVVIRLRGIVAELRALRTFYDRHKLVDRIAEGPEDEINRAIVILDDATDEIEGRV